MTHPTDESRTPAEVAEDAILDDLTEQAVGPYAALLTPRMNAHVRDVVRELLGSHPAAASLIGELKPPPVVVSSGEVPTESAERTDEGAGKATGSSR
jgi:hypothetical protein